MDANLENGDGSIAALFGESFFHSRGQADPNGLKDDDVHVESGDDTLRILIKELEETSKIIRSQDCHHVGAGRCT